MKKPKNGKKMHRRPVLSRRWREGSGRRLLLGLATTLALFVAAWARLAPRQLDYVEGDIARTTVRAPRGGVYVDPDEMERLRDEAAASVPQVYDPIPDATDKALTAVDDVFERFNEVRANPDLPDALSMVTELRTSLDIKLSEETMALAVRATTSGTALTRVRDGIAGLVRQEMAQEIRDNSADLQKARERIAEAVGGLRLTSAFTAMAREVGQAVISPNRVLNHEATAEAAREKRESVADVTHPVQPNDIIILTGEKVTSRHIAAFQAVGLMQATIDYTRALGVLANTAIIALLLGLFARRYASETYLDLRHLGTVAVLLVATAFSYRAVGPTWFESGAIAAVMTSSMIVAALFSVPLSMGVAVSNSLLLPIVAGGSDARLVIVTMLTTAAGIFMISRPGSKSRVIAIAAPATAACAAVMTVASAQVFSVNITGKLVGVAAVGGLAAPLLAMGASIALERILGVTTDFRLGELTNPNEPLLQRLIREAPGSYQASVMVGNLAEPAVEAIGGNALLVRVAAMYHDIGKLRRPYMFVENQFAGDNPHDRLSPTLSALVIISHVKDGLEIAREYGLPTVISKFIAEHHGTTRAEFFYQRARELAEDPDDVVEAGFRYPGPKPQSRETAVFMFADAIEAAARTLENPTQQTIQELVDRIIEGKITSGQLDEAPLSFRDLAKVKKVFVSTVTSMYHQRIKYPDQIKEAVEAHGDRAAQLGSRKHGDKGAGNGRGNGGRPGG